MRTLLRPKHQVLVLKCYPVAKNLSDPKPNPSELSYLLYYASSRRSKLQKVGEFLEKRTGRDVWRGRYGNVQVTLDILTAIIEKCPKDINLFAPSILQVLGDVLGSNDISLISYSLACFRAFCAHHDGAVLATDQSYLTKFESIITTYANFALNPPQASLSLRWRSIGLQAVKAIAASEALSSSDGKRQLELVVPVIVRNIYHENPDHLQKLVDMSLLSEDDEVHRLRLSLTLVPTSTSADAPTGIAAATAGTAEQADKLEEEDIGVSALLSLKRLFETSNVAQIQYATAAVLGCIVEKVQKDGAEGVSAGWAMRLLEMMAGWTPVQYRYLVLTTCQSKLTTTPIDDAALPTQGLLAKIVSCLLSSKVNLIGLSVMDVLLDFIAHISALLKLDGGKRKEEGAMTASPQRKELLRKLERCIGDLATHIYYSDQISDMVQELLAHLKATSSAAGPTDAQGEFFSTTTAAISGLRAIKAIFLVAQVHATTSGVGRNKVPIRVWEGSQWLLNEKSAEIRHAFIDAFVTWLDVEIGGQESVKEDGASFTLPELGQLSPRIRRTSGPPAWTQPQPIDSSTIFASGFLKLLLVAVYENAIRYANVPAEVMALHLLLTKIVTTLGFSAAMVALPMVMRLEDEGFQLPDTASKIALCSLALQFYATIASAFRLEESRKGLAREIDARKGSGQWFAGITTPPTDLAHIATSKADTNIVSEPIGVSENRACLVDDALHYADSTPAVSSLSNQRLKELLTSSWSPEAVQASLTPSSHNPSSLADSRVTQRNHHHHQGHLERFQVTPSRVPLSNQQLLNSASSSPKSRSTSSGSQVVRVEDLKRVLKGAPLTNSSGRYSDLSTSASGESVVSVGSDLVSSDDEAPVPTASTSSPRRSNASRPPTTNSPPRTTKSVSSRTGSVRRPRSATNRETRPPFERPDLPAVPSFDFDLPGSFPTDGPNGSNPVVLNSGRPQTAEPGKLPVEGGRKLKNSTSVEAGLHGRNGNASNLAVGGQRGGRLSVLELLDGLQAEKKSRGSRGGERPKSSWGDGEKGRVRPPY